MPNEGQKVLWCTDALGVGDLGRTSPRRPPERNLFHTFTKARPLSPPHGYDTQLQAANAVQAATAGLPRPLPHQSCVLWPGPGKSGQHIAAEGQKVKDETLSDLPCAWHGVRQSRDSNHARVGSPQCIWLLLGSTRAAEKALKVNGQPLTPSARTTTILPPDACCNRQTQYSPRGLESTCKTRAKGQALLVQMRLLAFPGIASHTLCSWEH